MFVVFEYKAVFKMAVDKPLRASSLRAFKISQIIEFVSGKDIRSCLRDNLLIFTDVQKTSAQKFRIKENKSIAPG